MVQTTPSQPPAAPSGDGPRRSVTAEFRARWPYAVSAIASVVLLFMMVRPWMVASGWDGKATVDAFGRIRRTTRHLNLWSQAPPPGAQVGALWAILIVVATLVLVVAAWQAVFRGNETAGAVTALAAVAIAIFVLAQTFTLQSKIPEVGKALGMGSDLGPQIGMVVGALRGTSPYPWPADAASSLRASALTEWAYASIAVSFLSAAVSVLRSWRSGLRTIAAFASKLL
ncbi:hypothetical protein [Nocardia yamanashiensis]|uniref:hypothetical protein n=1 Tax=Nocardia yamanashiensis TaxID=209247 RepID=UPI00082EE775|nr:hypothetical protein [Nocardia yamanashiensis]